MRARATSLAFFALALATGTCYLSCRGDGKKDPPVGTLGAGGQALSTPYSRSLYESTRFLYVGPRAVQFSIDPDLIKPDRVLVLHGTVRDRSGQPLPGVQVTVVSHPEFGHTATDDHGLFYLVINDVGPLTVDYARGGFVPAHRSLAPHYLDYNRVPELWLRTLDPAQRVDLSQPGVQVARGSLVIDGRGARRATLLFAPGTRATMIVGKEALPLPPQLDLRITEQTEGGNDPRRLHYTLPGNQTPLYSLSLIVDQAQRAGASEVRFDPPLSLYADNILLYPVGFKPAWHTYQHSGAKWTREAPGRIVKVVGVKDGQAQLDTDGDGQAEGRGALDAQSITGAEQQKLATLYTPGQQLVRATIAHFSSSGSDEIQGSCCACCVSGACRYPDGTSVTGPPNLCLQPGESGSVIECLTQYVGESFPVVGTPFSLNYQSNRVPGIAASYSRDIVLTGPSVPADLVSVQLEVDVAGQVYQHTWDPAPNLRTTYTWDGKDTFGQVLGDTTTITTTITYVYQEEHGPVPYSIVWSGPVGLSSSARARGLGGTMVDVHHSYDPQQRVVYLGSGQRVMVPGQMLKTVAGGGTQASGYVPALSALFGQPAGVAVSPSTWYTFVPDSVQHQVKVLDYLGYVSVAVGTGTAGYAGDGGPATAAQLNQPGAVAFEAGNDGTWFIADTGNHVIRSVSPGGIITTIAGTGVAGYSGDGGPATSAQLSAPQGLAVYKDGSIYIADTGNHVIRLLAPDGTISTVGGNGTAGFSGDGGHLANAVFNSPTRITIPGYDRRMYITDTGNQRVRRVDTWGVVSTAAGTGVAGSTGDGGPATAAQLNEPMDAVYRVGENALYIVERTGARVRRVDPVGNISTVAGTGTAGLAGDGDLSRRAQLSLPTGVALHPTGVIMLADGGNARVRRLSLVTPSIQGSNYVVPSADGALAYVFDAFGVHQQTLDALTGTVRHQFNYAVLASGEKVLSTITDQDCSGGASCNVLLSIERDADGKPTALLGADGQQTTVTLDANGYLAGLTNPAGEAVSLSWDQDLMQSWTDARGGVHTFTYNGMGRLTSDAGPGGSSKSLSRTEQSGGWDVSVTTAMGRTGQYKYRELATGGEGLQVLGHDGLTTTEAVETDGSRSVSYPDGSSASSQMSPDPRFGAFGGLVATQTQSTPGGLTRTQTMSRAVTLADPNNPLIPASQTDTTTINGRTFTSAYSAESQMVTTTTPEGRQSTTTLDTHGRDSSVQVPGMTTVQLTYDARSRVTQVTQGARTYTLAYDTAGNLASTTDSLSQVTSFTYDLSGRPLTQTLPDSRVIQFSYDENGNVTSITPPGRSAHAMAYTPADLNQSYTPPDVGAGTNATQYTYNVDKQVTLVSRPDGQSITMDYDTAGRLSTMTVPGGQVGYAYDGTQGTLSQITSVDGGTVQYAYDGSLLTDIAWTGTVAGTVHRAYDNNFRITSESVDGGNTASFTYDQDGLLTGSGSMTLSRDADNGLLTGTTLGQVTDAVGYNSFAEVTSYGASYNDTSQLSVQYTRDALGRITQKAETIQGESHTYEYTYDTAGRLTQVKKDGTVISAYAYDSNSNRASYTNAGGTVTSGTYDAQDRLTAYGTKTYTYTASGELQQKTDGAMTTSYTYDVLGNLTAATLPDGTSIAYVVDGQNRRIGKKVGGTLVQGFIYGDQLRVLAELDGSGNVVSRFVYGAKQNAPDYMIKAGTTYRIVSDHLGSTRLIINTATGAIAQRMDIDEFGNVLQDTSPGFQPFGFAGGLYDRHTKLVRFGARDYDSETGRWVVKDPLRFEGGDTDLYGYVRNDPINQYDPEGLWSAAGVLNFLGKWGPWGVALATVFAGAKVHDDAFRVFPIGKDGITDKHRHCYAHCELTRCMLLLPVSPTVGVLWEVKDEVTGWFGHGTGFDWEDVEANNQGWAYGYNVMRSCKGQCTEDPGFAAKSPGFVKDVK